MSTTLHSRTQRLNDRRVLPGLVATVVILVVGLAWAKWWPAAVRIDGLAMHRSWEGGALVERARDAPTWSQGAWEFTLGYTQSVWRALVAGLIIAASIDAFLPRGWLRRALSGRDSTLGAALAGAASLPTMMCTCCAAPVAISLRRSGVRPPSVVAFWLGNPVLNPAVLVFLALVGPWEWAATRFVVGIALVLGAAALADRLAPELRVGLDAGPSVPGGERSGPVRLIRSLARFTLTLVPEYLVLVALVGAAVHSFSFEADWVTGGGIAVLVVALVVALLVIPTGGEIPILMALAAVGAAPWALGLVLLALPAVSLPSLLMVGPSLTWRVTTALTAAVVVAGLVAGAVLAVVP